MSEAILQPIYRTFNTDVVGEYAELVRNFERLRDETISSAVEGRSLEESQALFDRCAEAKNAMDNYRRMVWQFLFQSLRWAKEHNEKQLHDILAEVLDLKSIRRDVSELEDAVISLERQVSELKDLLHESQRKTATAATKAAKNGPAIAAGPVRTLAGVDPF